MKSKLLLSMILILVLITGGCSASSKSASQNQQDATNPTAQSAAQPTEQIGASQAPADTTTIMIAAAASMETILTEDLIPMFEEQNPGIQVEGTYDSSGKLQTQIEEGMVVDLFFSAATKQMDQLTNEGLIAENTRVDLLKNRIVLIIPADATVDIAKFEDITKADRIAIGDPDSVPAGQYAKEALTSLGLWDEVIAKASLGTNVNEVLNWVAEGSADAGIVYATDASLQPDKIKIVAEASSGSLKQDVIYPVAVIKASAKQVAAQKFIDFLASKEAMQIFESYGFTDAKE